jgi:hypothetical protein
VRTGAALCAVPLFFDSPAQAAFEGPGPIELGTGATHIQLLRVRHVAPQRCAILHLDDLVARATPRVVYQVRLNQSHTVGTVAFSTAPSHRAFDVTASLPPGDRIVVSLVPHGTPARAAAPRIGRLCLSLT